MSELSGSSSAWFRVLIHASMHFSRALAKWLQMDRQLEQRPPDRIAALPRTKRNPNPCYAKGIAYSKNASTNYFTFTTEKVKTWLQICEMVQAYPRNQKLYCSLFIIVLFCPVSSLQLMSRAISAHWTLKVHRLPAALVSVDEDAPPVGISPSLWFFRRYESPIYIHFLYLLINLFYR